MLTQRSPSTVANTLAFCSDSKNFQNSLLVAVFLYVTFHSLDILFSCIWCRVSESNTLYLTKPDYKSGAIPFGATRQNFTTGTPNEIRTRVTCVKGGCPRPLDDGSITLVRLDRIELSLPRL